MPETKTEEQTVTVPLSLLLKARLHDDVGPTYTNPGRQGEEARARLAATVMGLTERCPRCKGAGCGHYFPYPACPLCGGTKRVPKPAAAPVAA